MLQEKYPKIHLAVRSPGNFCVIEQKVAGFLLGADWEPKNMPILFQGTLIGCKEFPHPSCGPVWHD